jgi:hypothetical protein
MKDLFCAGGDGGGRLSSLAVEVDGDRGASVTGLSAGTGEYMVPGGTGKTEFRTVCAGKYRESSTDTGGGVYEDDIRGGGT